MIPATAHFIWFGSAFPWVHALAIRSALQRGGFERAVLHHDDDLSASPHFRALSELPGFETRPVDLPATLQPLGGELGEALLELSGRLTQPAARANLLRAALLAREGGVYLDMDTVTVRSLSPLREQAGAFCGEESIVVPSTVARSRNPAVWLRAGALSGARAALCRVPGGWRGFRRIERFYVRAVNNAVLGAAPGHPFVMQMLQRMVQMPRARQRVRYALGTHLLQQCVADADAQEWGEGLVVHPPEVFYPLPPEISRHWFHRCDDPPIDAVLTPQTRVVHWYASVDQRELIARLDPDYVRAHAGDQLFCALAARFLSDSAA